MPAAITEFFQRNRRRVRLVKWQHQDHKRIKVIKMELQLYLSNMGLLGAPDWVIEQFQIMEKENSATSTAKLSREAEGMTLEIYSTLETKERSLLLTGSQMKDFKLVKSGTGEKAEVLLEMSVYTPANVQQRDYCWDMRGYDFWVSFDYDQKSLDLWETPEADEEDEADDDESDEHPAEVKTAATPAQEAMLSRARKNNPPSQSSKAAEAAAEAKAATSKAKIPDLSKM